jgi:hypothetical protein
MLTLLSRSSATFLPFHTMYDPNGPNDQLQVEEVSANRPPQFKESTCGYRCGWGCCEPDGGGDSESDAAPTLIGSEDEDEVPEGNTMRAGLDASHHSGSHNDRDAVPIVLVNDFEESLQLNQHLFAHGDTIAPSRLNWDYDESVNSLGNQAGSEPHSSAASDRRSTGSPSPYGWDTGIGGWTEDSNANRLPGYFCVTPLRLSAQFEHCRGPVASHMVIQDYSTLLDIAGEDWRVHMPVDHWSMYPHSGFPTR